MPVATDRVRPRAGPHAVSGIGYPLLVIGLAVALVLVTAVAVGVGTVAVPVGDVLAVARAHLLGGPPVPRLTDQIVWELRVPRVLLAGLAGAGLSLAGVCLQNLVRNPLADPYLFGVASGASLGAVLAMSGGLAVVAGLGFAGWGVTAAAFAGSVLSLLVVFLLAQRGGRLLGSSLVLAGVAVAYLASAATSYVQLQAKPGELRAVTFWLLGSVAGGGWSDLGLPSAALLVTGAVLLAQARRMNALAVGDDTAAGLGVDVNRLRLLLLVASSLLTATVVAVAGGIGFVGLMVPHAVRLLVGPDHRRLLPVSVLLGAVFLVLIDLLSRTVDPPNEMPIGIFTAAIGAPFFLWLLRSRRGVWR